ncbi:MAG: 3-deoxy-D-manno-octulosonic acid transferase [Gemmataceae bacterium]|nr:3-deoxy-D-manno-octulosonic acid transferase [Gemmataceae bacterium]
MPYLLNLVYVLVLVLASPWLMYRALATGKYRRGWRAKLWGDVLPLAPRRSLSTVPARRCVWFHGVSVGEIHLVRPLVAAFRRRYPQDRVVISSTTDTGYDEARKWFPEAEVCFWPCDFSWAVHRALDQVRPDLVVLAESELWPNFIWAAARRRVKLAIINGRMSPRSAARFRKVRRLARSVVAKLDLIAAQTEEYAAAYRELGCPNVVVTGSVKYDGAGGDRGNARTNALRTMFGIGAGELVLVAGSTQAPEEAAILSIYRRARERCPRLRLIIVPRHQDRFEEVARLLAGAGVAFARRSELGLAGAAAASGKVILVDTIGELNAVWGLADVAFVGGSFDGLRGGQNMIEPAAYGAAVLFGPHTWNFQHIVSQLKAHQAAIECADTAALEREVVRLLSDGEARRRLGEAARNFVQAQQGATEKTILALGRLLDPQAGAAQAA